MKTFFSLLAFYLFTYSATAQAPEKFSYQSVIRNAGNQLVANQSVGIKISILQGTANGTAVYAETHSPLTNANGLATLEIGGGTLLSGNFATINWANGPYFVKTETDLNGGVNYTITSTTQLLSVPYALYSNTVSSSVSQTGDTLFIGSQAYVIPGISAANSGGGQAGITAHSCGATNAHNPNLTYGSITDQDGNTYKTIVIGTQEWMAENLKVSHYRNGDPIPLITNSSIWAQLNTGATCWYNNDSVTYNCPYGKLYNWYAVADQRNVCPTGWHVPSDAEWTTLTTFLGGELVAGGKMKSTGTQYWTSPNSDADNSSGFSGLPGGLRYFAGALDDIGYNGYWWSSSQFNGNSAWYRGLYYELSTVGRTNFNKLSGFSVRCLKD